MKRTYKYDVQIRTEDNNIVYYKCNYVKVEVKSYGGVYVQLGTEKGIEYRVDVPNIKSVHIVNQ